MEDKKLNNQESLELITSMINKTKRHLHIGEGNLLLVWGYTSAIVTLLVMALMYITDGNPACNWLWFLIWIIGGIATIIISKKDKQRVDKTPVTYVDRLTSNLWCTIGILFGVATLMCFVFMAFDKHIWIITFVMALMMIGFAVVVQGHIFREKSMVIGGLVSAVAGIFIAGCVAADVPLKAYWALPLMAVCFIFSLIIPGHVLNAKAKKQC